MYRRTGVIGLAAALMLTPAGCHSGGPKGGGVSASPAPPVSVSLAPSAAGERDALAAYRGMWDAFVDAAKTSDPDAPQLRQYATDNALKLIVGDLYTNRARQKVILGDLKIDPKVTAATPAEAPTEASIVDCVNDENWLEYKKSGGLVDHNPGGRHKTTATVKLTAAGWKVTRFVVGDASC